MVVRFYCDACDRSLTEHERRRFVVGWSGTDIEEGRRNYDLCAVCLKMYIQAHNPITWPRLQL